MKKTPPTPPAPPTNRGQGRHKLPFETELVGFWMEKGQAEALKKHANKSAFARELFSKNGFPFGEPITI